MYDRPRHALRQFDLMNGTRVRKSRISRVRAPGRLRKDCCTRPVRQATYDGLRDRTRIKTEQRNPQQIQAKHLRLIDDFRWDVGKLRLDNEVRELLGLAGQRPASFPDPTTGGGSRSNEPVTSRG
jgi:hypothetical protein